MNTNRKKIKIGDCFKSSMDRLHVVWCTQSGWPCEKLDDGRVFVMDTYNLQRIETLHLPIGNDPKKYGGAWFDMIRQVVKEEVS